MDILNEMDAYRKDGEENDWTYVYNLMFTFFVSFIL